MGTNADLSVPCSANLWKIVLININESKDNIKIKSFFLFFSWLNIFWIKNIFEKTTKNITPLFINDLSKIGK